MNPHVIIPKGIVQRNVLDYELGTFTTDYRTRNLEALFAQDEWGWGEKADAYIFELFNLPVVAAGSYERSAEAHAEMLKEQGVEHVHPIVYGTQAAVQRAERLLERDRELSEKVRREFEPGAEESPEAVSEITRRNRQARANRGLPPRRRQVSPEEAFELNERRNLA